MSNDDISGLPPDVQARIMWEHQRRREQTGINAAAEMGVFTPGEPPELAIVRARDAEVQAQWDRAHNPQRFTDIPTYDTDVSPEAIATPNVAMPIREQLPESTVTPEVKPCDIEQHKPYDDSPAHFTCYTHRDHFDATVEPKGFVPSLCPTAIELSKPVVIRQPSMGDVIDAAFPEDAESPVE